MKYIVTPQEDTPDTFWEAYCATCDLYGIEYTDTAAKAWCEDHHRARHAASR